MSAGRAHPHHAVGGYLDPAIFAALIEDLVEVGARFDALILFWLGEPLLHPHFGEIWREAVRVAVQHGTFGTVEVHTNATHLDARKTRVALNAAEIPQHWHLSLDAIDRETYRQVKGVDRFERVQANVEAFLAARERRGAPWPRPVLQFIYGENNAHEARAFREHWEASCRRLGSPVVAAAGHVPPGEEVVILFRQLDCPTAEAQERTNALFRAEMGAQGLALPAAAVKGERVEARNLTPCAGFWKSPVVGWQGDLTTCTRDNLYENRVGSLREARFTDLWWGGRMRGRREQVARGDYGGLDACGTCFIPRSLNHGELAALEISAQASYDRRAG